MEDYFVDKDTLGSFIDQLNAQNYQIDREEGIRELDDAIGHAVMNALSDAQVGQLNALLDNPEATEKDFEEFFHGTGADFQKIITRTLNDFAAKREPKTELNVRPSQPLNTEGGR